LGNLFDLAAKLRGMSKKVDSKITGVLHESGKRIILDSKTNHDYNTRSGDLENSQHYAVEGNVLEIFFGVYYAPYIELGTKNKDGSQRIRPRLFVWNALQRELPVMLKNLKELKI